MNTILIKPLLAVLLIVSTISYGQEKTSTDLSPACKEYIKEALSFFGKKKYDIAFNAWEEAHKLCDFQQGHLYSLGLLIKGKQTYYSYLGEEQKKKNVSTIVNIAEEGLRKFPQEYRLIAKYSELLEYDKNYKKAYKLLKRLIYKQSEGIMNDELRRFVRVNIRLIKADSLSNNEKKQNFNKLIDVYDERTIKGKQSFKAELYANMGLFLSCEDIAKQAEKDKALLESKSSVRGYYLKAFETNKCKTNSTLLSIKKEQQKAVNQVKEYEIDDIAIDEYDDIEVPEEVEDDPVYTVVEKMPEFPGGQEALMRYIGKNIKYTRDDNDMVQSKYYFEFVIEKDGSTSNHKSLKVKNKEMSEQYLKVIKAMPTWTPGEQRGKKVRVKYVLPINICLK